jgi:hypothetical protein
MRGWRPRAGPAATTVTARQNQESVVPPFLVPLAMLAAETAITAIVIKTIDVLFDDE